MLRPEREKIGRMRRFDPALRAAVREAARCLRADVLPPPDVAERLEQIAESLLEQALRLALPQNDGGASVEDLARSPPWTTFDRVAAALVQRVVEVAWLDEEQCGLWHEVASTIYLCRSLRALARLIVLAHEDAHVRIPRALHSEVWYLTLALLAPRSLVAQIPARRAITGAALCAAAPWPLPIELAELRATLLRRAESASG